MSRRLAKKLADVKPGSLYAGVDVALDRNYTMVMNGQAEILAQFQFANDRAGYDYFYRRLDALQERRQAPATVIGMEPTNFFWKLLAADLEQHQKPYRLVNPYTVRKHREGDQLDRSKDDPRDAFTIADLLRTGKFTETRLLHGAYAELRQYATLHERLECEIRRSKNLIWNTAGQLFPELSQVFEDWSGTTVRALFRRGLAAAEIRDQPEEQFLRQVRAEFHGHRLMVSKLRCLYDLAATSVRMRDATAALQLSLRLFLAQLEALETQDEQVRIALTDTFLELPEAPYLLSVPALGLLSAATLLAEIGDPRHYHRAAQLIKLAGTQPVPNTTGRRTRSQTPMSLQGRPRLRTVLYFAVLRLIQVDPVFAAEYAHYQQRAPNPLTKMQAVGVLMNKLLRIVWALMKDQVFYNVAFTPTA